MSRCGLISILSSILMGLFGMAFFASESEQTTPPPVAIEATATTTAAPESHISTVNGVEINIEAFRQRVMVERWFVANEIRSFIAAFGAEQTSQQYGNDILALREPTTFGDDVLNDMELQILLGQEVEQRGLVVDNQAIDNTTLYYLASFLVSQLTPTPISGTPVITPIPGVRATLIAIETDFYSSAGRFNITEAQIREIFYLRALRAALREEIARDVPMQEIWVDSRHILIRPPEDNSIIFTEALCESKDWQSYRDEAEAIIGRLNAGESFAVLAQELSDDKGSGENGGELGWGASKWYVEPFKEAVETAPIGEIFGPICSSFGFHIIEVLDREWRDIEADNLAQLRNEVYHLWEIELFSNATIQRRDNWQRYVPDTPTYNELLGDIFG